MRGCHRHNLPKIVNVYILKEHKKKYVREVDGGGAKRNKWMSNGINKLYSGHAWTKDREIKIYKS